VARCSGITRGGTRCRLDALPGAEWCYSHDPQRAGERSRNARKAGQIGGRGRPGQPEIADIKSGLYGVITGVLDGSTERGPAAVAVQAYNVLIRAIEVQRKIAEQDELESRLAALEATQTAGNGKGSAWVR
jgi:hypothetical protein